MKIQVLEKQISTANQFVRLSEELDYRPCGNHGFQDCPKGPFKCGTSVTVPDPVL